MKIQLFIERKSELKFIGRLIEALVADHDVCLASFDKLTIDDGVDFNRLEQVQHLKGLIDATLFFRLLDCDWLITTQPGLGQSYFKKSLHKKVRYAHIPHALISLHSGYEPGAFDQFDAILSCGHHHYHEARWLEAQQSQPRKDIIPYGYEPLSTLSEQRASFPNPEGVVLAPSWNGPLAEFTTLLRIFESFKTAKQKLIFRPHDLLWRSLNQKQQKKIAEFRNVEVSLGNQRQQDLLQARTMICDYSGVSFEFGFGLQRPVLFFDQGKKGATELTGVETSWRVLVGTLFTNQEIPTLPDLVKAGENRVFDVNEDDFIYDCRQLRAEVLHYLREARWS